MTTPERPSPLDRMVGAYEKMLERVHETVERAGSHVPTLRQNLADAREKAIELGELTREEAEKVASYIERDIQDAAVFIAESGQQMRDWWRFDLRQMEEHMLGWFTAVADQTSLQLREMAEQARRAQEYHTGEVTGPGTLVCAGCGKAMHFKKPGHIPPCPQCKGTEFRREGTD